MKVTPHLTLRVAWHDSKWNGKVCKAPSSNSFCVMLDRVREERNDKEEDALQGRDWCELTPEQLPPCKAESGGFMNSLSWKRKFKHPYVNADKCKESHGDLKPRLLEIPAYTAIAVPFLWMLRKEQKVIDERLAEPLAMDEKPPFPSPWVFGKERQCALLEHFFGKLEKDHSLVFFYAKEGHPLGDGVRRLVVGVGTINRVGKLEQYDGSNGPSYPLWDRLIGHSIRPDGDAGFLLPYHDYLEPTGNAAEDERRKGLLREIIVEVEVSHFGDFSYAAEVTRADVALSTLVRCLKAVQQIRSHDIAKGPWQARENWLNARISEIWMDRGLFPGTGSALEALGLRMGTALVLEMRAREILSADKNPWPAVIAVLTGNQPPPQEAYRKELAIIKPVWDALPEERRTLLKLLSRFDLTPAQSTRFFDHSKRAESISPCPTDAEIIANPYILAERDLGAGIEIPISMTTIDRGLLPDEIAGANDPVPEPSRVDSPKDPRRVRCALVSVLRRAAADGDSLLSLAECQNRLEGIDSKHPIQVSSDWLRGHVLFVSNRVGFEVLSPDGNASNSVEILQLVELARREERLRKVLTARTLKEEPSLGVDWNVLLTNSIRKNGGEIDLSNQRHQAALAEQALALENITTRRLSILIGQAGTGKTSIVGALVECGALINQGVLLLAPTGKARVRLAGATGIDAMTVAQFLNRLGRYDGIRQRPTFDGDNPRATKYSKAKTVVIDEASMLTMDYLQAILDGLDLAHVTRLILVGDPNQLPPIGVGRPFVDLVSQLENAPQIMGKAASSGAVGRLQIEVRTKAGAPSDALRLASWYTNQPVSGDAERVLSEVGERLEFNDLEVAFWKTPNDLRSALLGQFQKHLGLKSADDVEGFNNALGYVDGNVVFANPDGIENFQILSPERAHPYGVHDLNRWIQGRFRAKELRGVREFFKTSIGDEDIVIRDKVIQLINQTRDGYNRNTTAKEDHYIANGDIGGVGPGQKGFLNVAFAGKPNLTFGYRGKDFSGDSAPLELAYALTIHKAQGSQFKTVFVVLPKASRLLSRELLYTALTRSRDRLVLLIEGDSSGILHELSKPERSDAARRNTNLFSAVVRREADTPPYAEHLIHKTLKGHMVRSKSELIIADKLFNAEIAYEYEKPLDGAQRKGCIFPDFSFTDAAGDLIIWEHFGRMDDPKYVDGHDWKLKWYADNGFNVGENLFLTTETLSSGVNSSDFDQVLAKVKIAI
jgi:ATP-dependent exoDNAse (exonuclease V) alpha subunit